MLVGKVRRRVYAAEQLDDLQPVDRAVRVVDGVQYFFRAIFRRSVAVLDGQAATKYASGCANLAASEK